MRSDPDQGEAALGSITDEKWDEQVASEEDTVPMKKPAQHLIAEVPRRRAKFEIIIGIDLAPLACRDIDGASRSLE